MPDTRTHRGAHPQDEEWFAPQAWPRLKAAVADLSWLLTRGYADPSALKIVGDRYELTQRQRMAVMRCACTDEALVTRRSRLVPLESLRGEPLRIDGYNVLTTIEVALGGGFVFEARDGCYRDIAGVHGTYRKVEETQPALVAAGHTLAELGAGTCTWYLDSPVGNSGQLRSLMLEVAREMSWEWAVELVPNADAVLIDSAAVITTADSAVLDRCRRWSNLAKAIVDHHVPQARVVRVGD